MRSARSSGTPETPRLPASLLISLFFSPAQFWQSSGVWQPLVQHWKNPEQGESLVQRQAPLLQRLLLVPQVRPHVPQLFMSLVRSRHVPLQQL